MKQIAFLVYPEYSVMALSVSAAFEVVNQTQTEQVYDIDFISENGGLIRTSSGLLIDTNQYKNQTFDSMIVGGGTIQQSSSEEFLTVVKTLASNSQRIISICTGAFVLAEAGLLDGRRVTTHWMHARDLQKRFPKVVVDEDQIFINDGPVWTSAGMTAGIDLALALIEDDLGHEIAKSVAKKLVVYHRRAGGQSQFSSLLELEPTSDRIRVALTYAKENLHQSLTVEILAQITNLSPRQFSRRFTQETGQSPAKAIENLRIEMAKTLIEQSNHPLEVIAEMTGFIDPDRMRRAFLRSYGQPPQVLRRYAKLENIDL